MRVLVGVALLSLVAGCASTGPNQQASRLVVDWEEVQKREYAASRSGPTPSRVIWVNYPRKRVAIDEEVIDETTQNNGS